MRTLTRTCEWPLTSEQHMAAQKAPVPSHARTGNDGFTRDHKAGPHAGRAVTHAHVHGDSPNPTYCQDTCPHHCRRPLPPTPGVHICTHAHASACTPTRTLTAEHTCTHVNVHQDVRSHKHAHTLHFCLTMSSGQPPPCPVSPPCPPASTHSRGPWIPSWMLITSRGGATSWHR